MDGGFAAGCSFRNLALIQNRNLSKKPAASFSHNSEHPVPLNIAQVVCCQFSWERGSTA